MLTHLHIQNFIIIESLDLEFHQGLTVITGETGAGKSIIIDALSLLVGGRADSQIVGPHQDKCHLSASFIIDEIPAAKDWLIDHDYLEKGSFDCIIRRVIHQDGKSRQMINGIPCTLQQLKEFMPLLMNIHSQNQHQLLTKRNHQRDLLDAYSNNSTILEEVKNLYQCWLENQQHIERLLQLQKDNAQRDFLEFQVTELEKAALLPNEYEQLDKEHKQLSNAEQILTNCQTALTLLSEDENRSAQTNLYQAQNSLQNLQNYDEKIATIVELLNHSIIHLEEAIGELRTFIHQIEINPERLNYVEKRLAKLHELSRKYQTAPQTLSEVSLQLQRQLTEFSDVNNQYEKLLKKSDELKDCYHKAANQLHKIRLKSAKFLDEFISQEIQKLGMRGGQFHAQVTPIDELTAFGSDQIEFLVATNPGQTLQPLSKVASGGEISRMALAIYVATAQKKTTPILVFDEVDVGIGGGTAAIVGKMLQSLSQSAQVFCITHLPQVAAFGNQHLCVKKSIVQNQTITQIIELTDTNRVEEIARMLGGMTITEKTLAHAKELICHS